VTCAHLCDQPVELLDTRQRYLFTAHWSTFHKCSSITVNDAGFHGVVQHMPKNRDGVVVPSRRHIFPVVACPFLAVILRDFTDFSFIQARPAFLKGEKALSPVIPSAGFDAQVVIKIAEMNSGGLAECHFRRDFAIAIIAEALAMLLEKFRQLSLGHAKVRCAKSLPNLFAAGVNSRIISPGFMANEILEPRSLPRFGCHFLFQRFGRRTTP
jgi:hypothetical protein